jgi:transketolase
MPVSEIDWTDLDKRAVDTSRVLAMDAVQKVGNGHPGTAMSLAPVAYTLFNKVMRHSPANPDWPGRDRFVLSAGHSSITLYTQLYLAGFGLEIEDLQALRTWGSKTHRRGGDHDGPLGPGRRQRGGHGDGRPARARSLRPRRRARRERLRPPHLLHLQRR